MNELSAAIGVLVGTVPGSATLARSGSGRLRAKKKAMPCTIRIVGTAASASWQFRKVSGNTFEHFPIPARRDKRA